MAAVTLSLRGWRGVSVQPTHHHVEIVEPNSTIEEEPVSTRLVASLVHPDRKSNLTTVEFSSDGRQLLAIGNPSRVIQIWDIDSKKELRQLATPRQRSVYHAPQISSDWKTAYAPIAKLERKRIETAKERVYRVDYQGEIRVWDLVSGSEKPPLALPPNRAPASLTISPDDRWLLYASQPSHETDGPPPKSATYRLDLATGKQGKLVDGYVVPIFLPGNKHVAVTQTELAPSGKGYTSGLQILELETGKQLASISCPDPTRYFGLSTIFPGGAVSPDGSTIAVMLGGKTWSPIEVWFVDSATLKVRGKLLSEPREKLGGWAYGAFTSDSRRYVTLGKDGRILVWDLRRQRLEREIETNVRLGNSAWRLAVAPDGTTLAFACMDGAGDAPPQLDPDPRDFPQPKIHLYDLDSGNRIDTLVAPHGWIGSLRFSPDGKRIALGSAGAVHLFELSTDRDTDIPP